ncbi:MAG: hypothetical protein Q7U52_14915 [Hydrogenophaga sp.]|nr:hypothetical protein [Hydrogenophaga sp.]
MKNQLRVPDMPGKSSVAMDRWFAQLFADGLLFNPDDHPEDIVEIGTGEPTFTEKECQVLNASLDRLFKCHGDKVYDVALNYFHKAMGITPRYANA